MYFTDQTSHKMYITDQTSYTMYFTDVTGSTILDHIDTGAVTGLVIAALDRITDHLHSPVQQRVRASMVAVLISR